MCIVHHRSIAVNVLRPSGTFGVLSRESAVWDFFLESDCRAMRPVTMAFRLAPTCATSSSHLNLLAASDSPIRYPIRSSNLSSGISSRKREGVLGLPQSFKLHRDRINSSMALVIATKSSLRSSGMF